MWGVLGHSGDSTGPYLSHAPDFGPSRPLDHCGRVLGPWALDKLGLNMNFVICPGRGQSLLLSQGPHFFICERGLVQ